MDHPEARRRRSTRRVTALGGAVAAAVVTLAAFAPTASADPVEVKYGGCVSTDPAVAAAPADYTTTVTLTPQGTSFQVGKAITITWHYSISTAPGPTGIPIPNAASAKAKILIGGAATTTVTTGSSALFPPAPVAAGKTFQIPDMTATFTPRAAGTYTLTPGDNEQDPIVPGLVITCKASGAKTAATITVAAGSAGGGSTSTTGTGTSTSPATSAAATTTTSTISTLPHTGFDGRWLAGAAGLAAVLGGGGLAATRRRRGSHG